MNARELVRRSWLLLLALMLSGPVGAATISGSRTTNVNIPDNGGWVFSRIDIAGAPAGAVVTSVQVQFRCVHPHSGDLQVDLEVGTYTNAARLWDNEGGTADNPARTVTTNAFKGLPVNNGWYLYARDTEALDAGYIDEWSITITYETDNDPPNSFAKVSPPNGTGLTSYSVTFDWANASDPDGDTVRYNLVVNDDSGNSVAACAAEGLSASNRNCTLPQQPNRDYYWQVWAVDSNGNSREATGPFWHVWSDTDTANEPPNPFTKVSPSNGTGVTGYSANFIWNNAIDPDGDAVAYNLVVNDASGTAVAACTAEGLSTSNRACNLPQQPNADYYWQVWAVDDSGSSREASGPFWHLWTNTGANEPIAQMLWQNAVRTDAARFTQLHGEFDSTVPGRTHAGIDISDGTRGTTPIYPVLPGTVHQRYTDEIGVGEKLGNTIVIKHSEQLYSLYAHMTSPSARVEGSYVGSDDVLGTIDETGTSAVGAHLHLEVRRFPEPYLILGTEPTNCNQTYRCGDVRDDEYFLSQWIDPVWPKIGQFDPAGAKPSGFSTSASVNGWDVSPHRYSSLFQDAYVTNHEELDALTPKKNLGVPFDNGGGAYVHCWSAPGPNPSCINGVWIQDLKRTRPTFQFAPSGSSSLLLNPDGDAVFLLKEGFWQFYVAHDGFQNLGAPESAEEPFSGAPSFDGSAAVIQRFEKGVLYYHPNAQFDRTPPASDRITLLQPDLTTPVNATQGWHVIGSNGENFDLFQNGTFLCEAPCTDAFSVDGWRYTLTTPDVEVVGITVTLGRAGTATHQRSHEAKASSDAMVHDAHNFSFTATPQGGVVILQTVQPVFEDGFEGPAN